MSESRRGERSPQANWALAGVTVALGSYSSALFWDSLLREFPLAGQLLSEGLWRRIIAGLGGSAGWQGDRLTAEFPFFPFAAGVGLFSVAAWFAGAACISRRRGWAYARGLAAWGTWGWAWWLIPPLWELLDLCGGLAGWESPGVLLRGTLPLWQALMAAGWLTTGCALGLGRTTSPRSAWPGGECSNAAVASTGSTRVASLGPSIPTLLWLGMALYMIAFVAMNWGLYASLRLPHGDSAMYEEHLWNLLHGKGFRSYLDGGRLFLGEHIQVIHVLLIPLYLLWPSQLLLELCQSAALAAGAIPLFRIAARHTGSRRAATALALAYLLYTPLQFLDIAIDYKTFRPNSFEVPLFLWALDALELGRPRAFLAALGLALLCQEDAAMIIAPLGIWMALQAAIRQRQFAMGRLGLILAGGGVLYLVLVIKVILPWFRGGADVHFAQYFSELGDSSGSIVSTVLERPELVWRRLADVESLGFALVLLAPLGFLPLLSPARLAVAAPLFGVLCLSDITNSAQHHFHAPLVPILMWAAAAGAGQASRAWEWFGRAVRRARGLPPERGAPRRIERTALVPTGRTIPAEPAPASAAAAGSVEISAHDTTMTDRVALWSTLCAASCGVFLGMSPLSIGFWDPDSRAHWRQLYLPDERARQFSHVLEQIPAGSRVASTDFVHPRFTHHERSYDYSEYRREVPDDTDYIVIDTRHPHSRITRAEQVKELRDDPEQWEVLPDRTDGYFIILRRVRH